LNKPDLPFKRGEPGLIHTLKNSRRRKHQWIKETKASQKPLNHPCEWGYSSDKQKEMTESAFPPPFRHCEERSDEAIQGCVFWIASLLRASQ
jgi:hypothetical protein